MQLTQHQCAGPADAIKVLLWNRLKPTQVLQCLSARSSFTFSFSLLPRQCPGMHCAND